MIVVQAWAKSTRIPLGLFLNVGGKRENREKNAVSPAALSPSKVTLKVLLVSLADAVGLSCTKNSVQLVAVDACALREADARTAPLLEISEAVKLPLKVDPSANL